jgi:hypothetical protein
MDNPDTDNSGHNMTQDEDNPETMATVCDYLLIMLFAREMTRSIRGNCPVYL